MPDIYAVFHGTIQKHCANWSSAYLWQIDSFSLFIRWGKRNQKMEWADQYVKKVTKTKSKFTSELLVNILSTTSTFPLMVYPNE